MRRREELTGYLFIVPWALGFLVFTLGPMVASFVLSFFDYDVLRGGSFTGLNNYLTMFTGDEQSWHALKVSASYVAVVVPLSVAVGYLWALALNQKVGGLSFYRTAFYIPSLVPSIATTYLFWWILNSDLGLLNAFLAWFGLKGPDWFNDPNWALPAMYIMGLWAVGGNVILYLASFQGVPTEMYDAAKVDGANAWNRFRHVTIPMTSPVIFFTFITGIIGTFQTFTGPFIITNGGPDDATLFYILYLFRNAWTYFKMGYASALAWVLFVIILALTYVMFRISRRAVYYEGSSREEATA
jgi:multiple sugar transport system permease protein